MERLIDDDGNPYYSMDDNGLENAIEKLTGEKPKPMSDSEIADIMLQLMPRL